MSKIPSTLLALALLLACAPRPLGDTATDVTGDASTTTGSSGGATTQAEQVTTGGPTGPLTGSSGPTDTTGVDSTGTTEPADPLPDVGTGQACDLWAQDCPEGQKCAPVSIDGASAWDSWICVPVVRDPDGIGEACESLGTRVDGLDTCDVHMMCWDGVCLGHCTGTPNQPGCADPEAACQLTGDGNLNLCLPTCDPLQADCPEGQMCLPDTYADDFICVVDASGEEGQVFDACEYANACDPGLVCTNPALAPMCDPMQGGCCLPFCDTAQPDPCPGLDLECLFWFEEGMAPPDLETVGVCGIMP